MSQATCTVKALSDVARNTDARMHEAQLGHLGLISPPHREQLWPELSCAALGKGGGMPGPAALRAPAEGKLQGRVGEEGGGGGRGGRAA